MMKIVFDLDDTLFESNVIMDVVKERNLNFTRSDIKSWELWELPEDVRQEIYRRWKLPEYMCNLKPCDGAQNKIKELSEIYELGVVTSRVKDIEKQTREMVFDQFPEISYVHVVNGSKTKILNLLQPTLYVDDGPHYITESLNLGIDTIMISNRHTPYNHFLRSSVKWEKKVADIIL